MIQNYNILHVIAASTLLFCSSCDQKAADEPLLGKWGVDSRTLEFKTGGQLSIKDKDSTQTGTWERYGPDILLTLAGKEMTCGVNDRFENQIQLTHRKDGGPPSCALASPYWRIDPPAAKQTSSLIAFDCTTAGKPMGQISYTTQFRIEANKKSKLTCFGKTGTGCQLLWQANLVTDDSLSVFVMWDNGTGNMLDVIEGREPGKLELRQSSSTSCGTSSGMGSCIFSSYTPVGTCQKAKL